MAYDELLRIYTSEGELTETFKQRGEVHPGLWDVSTAGHIVSDDSCEMSLEREAFEELGIRINAREAKWLFTLQTESHSEHLHERVFQCIYLINKDISLQDLKPQVEEVA